MKPVVASFAAALAGAACSVLPRPSPAAREVVRGPLPTRIQHPLALVFPHFSARRAITQPRGTFGLATETSYASIFERASDGTHDVEYDGELLRSGVRVRVGLAARVDLETEVAALYAGGGFLDRAITEFHDLFGFPNSGRESVDDDQFAMRLRYDERELFALESNTPGLQDLPLVLTYAFGAPDARGWHHAARALVELPLGSDTKGFGSGGVDWGAAWCADASSGRWTRFFSASYVHPEQPDGFDGTPIAISELFELGAALEFRWSERTSLVAQFDVLSPLTDDVPHEELRAPMVDFGVGLVRDVDECSRVFVSFHDDVMSASGPDFALFVGYAWNL